MSELENMTLLELRNFAKEQNIKNISKLKKEELVMLLKQVAETCKPQEKEKPKEDETPKTEEEPKKEEVNTEDSDKQDVPNTEETDTDKKEETEVKATTPKSSNDLIYSLFDHLFAFLDSEPSDDNYVLMGYFNKIVNNLLNDHAKVILTYIFQDKPEIIPKLVEVFNTGVKPLINTLSG